MLKEDLISLISRKTMQLTEHLFSQCQNEDGNRTDWLGIQFTGIKLTYSSVSANIIIAVCDNLPSL